MLTIHTNVSSARGFCKFLKYVVGVVSKGKVFLFNKKAFEARILDKTVLTV
jgi:hypothetical protein